MNKKFELSDDLIACGDSNNASKVKKVIVYYVDVGQLSQADVYEFIDRVKQENCIIEEKLKDSCVFMYVPVRPNSSTRVETMNL